MPEHFGRLNWDGATNTQADRMVRDIEDWLAAHQGRVTYPFPASELHRRIGRVVYGGTLEVTIDGVDFRITRETVLEGLPCGSGPSSSSSS